MCVCVCVMQSSGALYGVILVSGGRVVAIEYEPGARGLQPLDAADLMCLDNFVCSNANIRCGMALHSVCVYVCQRFPGLSGTQVGTD